MRLRICFLLLQFALKLLSSNLAAQMQDNTIDKEVLSQFLQNEDYAETIHYLNSKNAEAFNDVFPLNALGYAYFMTRHYTDAEQFYSKTLLLDSLNFSANRYMALISNRFKKFDNQLFYYKRLVRLKPNEPMIYKLTADAYLNLSAPDSALQYYKIAYHMQPGNEIITVAFVDKLIEDMQYIKADSISTAFLKNDVLNSDLTRLLIKSYMAQKRMGDAAGLTQQWLTINEIDPKTSTNLSIANYSIRNYDAAFKVCDTLLQQGVESEALLYYAALARYKLNDYKASIQLLRADLDLGMSKNIKLYYFALADNYEELADFNNCIKAYDTVFYLFKEPLALYNKGRIYELHLKDPVLAKKYYQQYLVIAKPKTEDEKRVYNYVKKALANKN